MGPHDGVHPLGDHGSLRVPGRSRGVNDGHGIAAPNFHILLQPAGFHQEGFKGAGIGGHLPFREFSDYDHPLDIFGSLATARIRQGIEGR